jgi:hypothetical protein
LHLFLELANLYTTNTLNNTEGAYILAMNNLIMAKNSSNEKISLIKNDKATIQIYKGNMSIYAKELRNTTNDPIIKVYNNRSGDVETWTQYKASNYTKAKLLSGNNINFYVDNLVNNYSLIASNSDINFYSTNLRNNYKYLLRDIKTIEHKSREEDYSCIRWGRFSSSWSTCSRTVNYDVTSWQRNIPVGTINSTIQAY